MSADLRRAALEGVLKPLLQAPELSLAMAIYDQEFAHQQFFMSAKYLERLALTLALGERQRRVFAALNSATLAQASFVRNPQVGRRESLTSVVNEVRLSPALVVFGALCERVTQRLLSTYPATRQGLPMALSEQIVGIRADDTAKRELQRWAANPFEARLQLHRNEQTLGELVHLIYLWSCGALGPVKTDQIFAHVVRELEQMPEAAQFPPRRLM